MATSIHQRYKSGERCRETGFYQFEGYTDDSTNPRPTSDESIITMTAGDTFPPIRNPNKECYWSLIEGKLRKDLSDEASPPNDVPEILYDA
jgi:hypothetical protein